MQEKKNEQYTMPRYMGLMSVRLNSEQQYDLQFGYSEAKARNLTVDQKGLQMIRELVQPKTVAQLSSQLHLPQTDIENSLQSLREEGLVVEKTKVPKKLQRYDRHLLFYELQGKQPLVTQKKLSKARVALIGMGGIGSWVSMGLIGSGLKELRLIDFDTIELSNLTRQILFTEKDVGQKKIKVAEKRLLERNSSTKISTVALKLSGVKELRKALRGIDFVVLSADKPAKIHDWVDEICVERRISYLNVGYKDGVGIVGPMTVPGHTSCYQCHKVKDQRDIDGATHGRSSKNEDCNQILQEFVGRYQAPSFGPLNSLVSSIAVLEVIKFFTDMGELKSMGTELEVDPMTLQIRSRSYKRDENCWHCHRLVRMASTFI